MGEEGTGEGEEKGKASSFLSLSSSKYLESFTKGSLSPAHRRWTRGCSRGLEVRIPGVFQCGLYTFLCVVILPNGLRNTRVLDGFGTAAFAECLVSVYSLALVGLGEALLLSSCPLHPR